MPQCSYLVCISNYQFNLGVKGQGQVKTNSVIRLIIWIPLEGVHIWHKDCLWGVDYNIGFLSPLCHWCQKTRSLILTISLWLVMRTPPSFIDQWCSYLSQLLLLVCVYKVLYISPMWPWSQRLIRICLTVACFWQRCFIFCRIIANMKIEH